MSDTSYFTQNPRKLVCVLFACCLLSEAGESQEANRILNPRFHTDVSSWEDWAVNTCIWDWYANDATPGCSGSGSGSGSGTSCASNCFAVVSGETLEVQFFLLNATSFSELAIRYTNDPLCPSLKSFTTIPIALVGQEHVHTFLVPEGYTYAQVRWLDDLAGPVRIDDVYAGEPGLVFADDFESTSECRWQ